MPAPAAAAQGEGWKQCPTLVTFHAAPWNQGEAP